MKELKFRVWDTVAKRFCEWYNDDPFIKCATGDIFYHKRCMVKEGDKEFLGDEMVCDHHSQNNLILHQYTGLKDKNGREIYEGDIIYYEPSGFKKYAQNIEVKQITAENYHWLGELQHMLEDFDHKCQIEVIGNIFENPELCQP